VVNWVGEVAWKDRFAEMRGLVAGTWPRRAVDPVAGPPDVIVIESFRLRQGKAYVQAGSDFPSIQVQATFQTFVWDWNHTANKPIEIVFQEPYIMSRTQIRAEDDHLLQGSEHMKDSYRHARFYFITKIRVPK